MTSSAILVLGMHRSGTSALSGVLAQLGANPGTNLVPAAADVNAKGFWEHAEIVSIHDRILEALGSSWHDERTLPENWWTMPLVAPFHQEITEICLRDFRNSELWLLKDPRMCRLLPLWLQVLENLKCEPLFVLAMRHPREVAKSLFVRIGISEERSALLWLQHVLTAEHWTRNRKRVIVTFDEILTDWRTAIAKVQSKLPVKMQLEDVMAQGKIDDFLESRMRHFDVSADKEARTSRHRICELADSTWRVFMGLDGSNKHIQSAANIQMELASFEKTLAPWAGEIQALWTANMLSNDVDSRNKQLMAEVERIKNTLSWRVTKPFRALANVWRTCVKRV